MADAYSIRKELNYRDGVNSQKGLNMAEENNADSIQNREVAAPVVPSSNRTEEKMIPQSRVDQLMHERTRAVMEKTRQETIAEFQQQQQAQQQMPQQQAQQPNMGAQQQLSQADIQRMIAEGIHSKQQEQIAQAQRQAQEQEGMRVAQEYHAQIEAGKSKYPDYDEVTKKIDVRKMPHIAALAHATGNAADMIYELGKNPSKIGTLTSLAYINPDLAQSESNDLVRSIHQNQAGVAAKTAADPLSQLQPSTVGMDNGSMSLRDLKKQPWLRG